MSRTGHGREAPTTQLTRWLDRWRWVCFALLALLYAAGYHVHWRIYPDSALYVQVARNIAEGNGYVYHALPHDLSYPMLPWLIAGVWWLFGPGSWAILNALFVAIGLGALALVYRLIYLRIDRPTATVVTLLTGTMCVIYYYVFVPQTDVLFFLGTSAALAGYEGVMHNGGGRRLRAQPWLDWLILTGGLWLTISSRPSMWALVLAIGATVAWMVYLGRQRGRHLTLAGLTGACLGVFYLLDPRRQMQYVNSYAGKLTDPEQVSSQIYESLTWWFSQTLPRLLGVDLPEAVQPYAGAALWLGLVALALGLLYWRLLWAMLALATIAMLLVHLPVPRYFIPIAPLLLLAGWSLVDGVNQRLPRAWAILALALVLGLWLLPNGLLIGRFVYRQHCEPFLQRHYGGRFYGMPDLGRRLGHSVPEDAWVLAPENHRVLTWYAQRRVRDQRLLFRTIARIESAESQSPIYWLSWGRQKLDPAPLPSDAEWQRGQRVWLHELPDGRAVALWRLRRAVAD